MEDPSVLFQQPLVFRAKLLMRLLEDRVTLLERLGLSLQTLVISLEFCMVSLKRHVGLLEQGVFVFSYRGLYLKAVTDCLERLVIIQ